ncbi:MAG: AI-2E family transporter [Actinomycetota bacterium]|nr:AI-2E family transporter [Actinomycetota bacterium]
MTARTVAKAVLTTLAIVAALYVLYRLRDTVILVGLAVFVAVALAPGVAFVQRRGVPRALAILLVYVSLLGGAFALGLVLVPPIVEGVETAVADVPRWAQDIRDSETLRDYDERYHLTDHIKDQSDKLPGALDNAAGELETVTVGLFRRLFELVTVLVIAFFLLLDGPRWVGAAFRRLPADHERRARAVADEMAGAVGGYVVGSIGIAAAAGLFSFLMMKLLGLPFAVPLAVLMAFTALIPLIGSAIGAAPIALVAALDSFPTAVAIWLVAFVVYQQIESHVLGPYIYKRTLRLHPVLAIVAVLAGASLMGILGALLAIPIAAMVQILIREYVNLEPARPEPAPPASEHA